jgi:hypothetical protein
MVAVSSGGGMDKIGFLVIDNVPRRKVMLCAECEDGECMMAEHYLDRHEVPYKLIIVNGFDIPIIVTGRGDCMILHHESFGRVDIEERMDELRKYCA